ncbi:hypothetical protein ACFW1A_30655 [Kitasatospora sp. NPDC058965]|uniref:hypothetical protein n=1 Tax=Kitasatospora sp. NPDC058965 TaxID=3346682 RepID=UPI0036961C52
MREWLGRAVLALLAVPVLAGVAACSADGGLRDDGAARRLTPPPSAMPVWPVAAVAPSSPAAPSAEPSAPSPLPGVTVAGDDIRAAGDAATVLAQDPAVTGRPDEKRALTGCQHCQVLAAQYRDLTGDGHDELLTAVLTDDQQAVLHVYRLQGGHLLPVLALTVQPGFTADTVGTDLVVHEPTGAAIETDSTYGWNGVRLAFRGREIKATGPAADAPGCLPGAATPSPQWTLPVPLPRPGAPRQPFPVPSVSPSASPLPYGGSAAPTPAVPAQGAPAATSSARQQPAGRPSPSAPEQPR